ncbi:MAG: hypothetical protein CM15mP84_02900 [Cellvibrionales bacterium]|nr:MAG: hypothetical protein CM15mP84_02900 [Cellvibrionales bacterium]
MRIRLGKGGLMGPLGGKMPTLWENPRGPPKGLQGRERVPFNENPRKGKGAGGCPGFAGKTHKKGLTARRSSLSKIAKTARSGPQDINPNFFGNLSPASPNRPPKSNLPPWKELTQRIGSPCGYPNASPKNGHADSAQKSKSLETPRQQLSAVTPGIQ